MIDLEHLTRHDPIFKIVASAYKRLSSTTHCACARSEKKKEERFVLVDRSASTPRTSPPPPPIVFFVLYVHHRINKWCAQPSTISSAIHVLDTRRNITPLIISREGQALRNHICYTSLPCSCLSEPQTSRDPECRICQSDKINERPAPHSNPPTLNMPFHDTRWHGVLMIQRSDPRTPCRRL